MPKSSMLWYLSHPVRPDERYTAEQNLDHTLDVVKCCDGIILTGHRKSNGMERELEGLAPFSSLFNLIGIADSQLADMALQLLEEKYAPR
jgi:hypothetical protein